MTRALIRSTRWQASRPGIVTVEIEVPAGKDQAEKLTAGDYLKVKPAPWWHRAKLAISRKINGG